MMDTLLFVLYVIKDLIFTFLSGGQGWSLIPCLTPALPLCTSVLLGETAPSQEKLSLALTRPGIFRLLRSLSELILLSLRV